MPGWIAILQVAAAAAGPPASAPPAVAPTAKPAESSTTVGGITVEGRSRKKVEAFHAAVGQYVRVQALPGPVKQFTRWSDPVCPTTKGLTSAFNAFVTQRIKDVAARVGAPGASGCVDWAPNVEVVFSTEPQKAVDDVRAHHPEQLGFNYNGSSELTRFEPPIKAWYGSMTLWRDIRDTNNVHDRRSNDAANRRPFCIDMEAVLCHGAFGKGMLDTVKSRFTHVLVVIDASRTDGKAIGAVADEIAMTVLSRPGPREGCSALPSAMDVLDSSCADSDTLGGLTPYDEAFLRALYTHRDSELQSYERTAIERAVQAVGPPP